MPTSLSGRLDRLIAQLPKTYAGPGGAIAVVKDGEILVRHAWGYANAEQRIAFTPRTLFRMCSITKQFTCATLLDAFADPGELDAAVAARLPALEGPAPGALHLAHNQSGLRDYWAVAMLHGAPAESPFGDAEARAVIAGARTLQFAPGTSYSYCNQNFRILSDILQDRADLPFSALLRSRVFDPAGMSSAMLAADTRAMPDGAEGYEGSVATGFRAAENRILWTGDAGMGASLDDMIAWERHIDATRDDERSLYRRLSAPVTFADGAPAGYGFGLGRGTVLGRKATSHGGALRGWRSHRLHIPEDRLSVVVLFNHMADAGAAATDAVAATLDIERPVQTPTAVPSAWLGAYLEEATGLSARVEAAPGGLARLRYGHPAELIDTRPEAMAASEGARLTPADDGLAMVRARENTAVHLRRLAPPGPTDVAGRYRCTELAADLLVSDAGGALYGGFSGFLGLGRMEPLEPIGADVWALPCPRALDHTPPGDWTLTFRREDGVVTRVTVGCWLARGLEYNRAI